jgi:hypothetical protein
VRTALTAFVSNDWSASSLLNAEGNSSPINSVIKARLPEMIASVMLGNAKTKINVTSSRIPPWIKALICLFIGVNSKLKAGKSQVETIALA